MNSGDGENPAEKEEGKGEGEEQWRREGCFGKFLQWFHCHLARDERKEE